MTVNSPSTQSFTVNERDYQPPACPLAVICIDGCADDYLNVSIERGCMPHVARMIAQGFRRLARGALPSFTNVNNACIVTGVPPSMTGICGNFFLNPETGKEEMMNSAAYLRCETILAAAARSGRKVAMVTAKEKLLSLLGKNLEGIAFSAEKAHEATESTHGIGDLERRVGFPTPNIYSAEASLYVLRAGVALVKEGKADFLYLSLTDFMQHKYEPAHPASLDFYKSIDVEIGKLLDLGVLLGATADHGMNAKQNADGTPNVIYLETILREKFGEGIRVICPITDPYVRHHAALGSYVEVYLPPAVSAHKAAKAIQLIKGATEVYDRPAAAESLQLPADRIGDLVVLADKNTVLGRKPVDHDLSHVKEGLRTHGGRFEEMVPLLLSKPLQIPAQKRFSTGGIRNFDIFEMACNCH